MNQIPINIYSESTPNPESYKFVVNCMLLPDAILQVDSIEDAKNSPIAKKLFDFPFVKSIFINNNYITITRKPDEDWFEITPILKEFIKGYLEAGLEIISHTELEDLDEDKSPISIRIRQILAEYVQPAVEQDGGAITFKSFNPDSGVVTVMLKGSCSGCPSSTVTLKSGIENLLTRMVPEVNEVVADSL